MTTATERILDDRHTETPSSAHRLATGCTQMDLHRPVRRDRPAARRMDLVYGAQTRRRHDRIPPQWIPDPITFESFAGIYTSTNVRFFVNSLIYAGGSILLALAICIPAAYVATRYQSRRMEALMTGILVFSMVPPSSSSSRSTRCSSRLR